MPTREESGFMHATRIGMQYFNDGQLYFRRRMYPSNEMRKKYERIYQLQSGVNCLKLSLK